MFNNKSIFITGANRGIGLELVKESLNKENFKNDLEGYKFLKKDNIKDIIIQSLISSRKGSSPRT